MKKFITFILVLIFILLSTGCNDNAVLEKNNVYQTESEIRSLDIQIGAADFAIEQSEKLSVESNLKYLSVSEKDGILTIREKTKSAHTYIGAVLTLYIPAGTVFENVSITTGAANLTVDTLSAELLKLRLGAGNVKIENLNVASEADIEGGTGKITIAGGILNDLELEMGMGELDLTAALLGKSDLTLGVGAANLTLIGAKENYGIEIEKGLGSIKVDGKIVSAFSSGNGQNHVDIKGGIGGINLNFQEDKVK